MKNTNTDTNTDARIRTLATEAGAHGDTRMVVLCEIALWGESDTDPSCTITRDDARARCVKALANGAQS